MEYIKRGNKMGNKWWKINVVYQGVAKCDIITEGEQKWDILKGSKTGYTGLRSERPVILKSSNHSSTETPQSIKYQQMDRHADS
jgi:hypothetical protein